MAGIRAKIDGGLAGVMVTASHNPKQDNGLKIFEKDGSMLEQAWEKLAEDLVNTPDIATFLRDLSDGKSQGAFKESLPEFFNGSSSPNPLVFIGMDTRESSKRLCDAVS